MGIWNVSWECLSVLWALDDNSENDTCVMQQQNGSCFYLDSVFVKFSYGLAFGY